jgi:hypothetical protein
MYVSQRSAAVFTDTPGFFYAVGYINCDTGNDWLQTSHFIVRAAEYNADGDGRPIPVAASGGNIGQLHRSKQHEAPQPHPSGVSCPVVRATAEDIHNPPSEVDSHRSGRPIRPQRRGSHRDTACRRRTPRDDVPP